MSEDDPFDDDDRTTFVRPRPGGRVSPDVPPAAPTTEPPLPPMADAGAGATALVVDVPGMGPILCAAAPLLGLAVKLRNTLNHADPGRLFARVTQEVRAFEEHLLKNGVRREDALIARYCVCTFVDEAALSTPWGATSGWQRQSLLSAFHGETWGGKKFFEVLERMMREPAGHVDLLELLTVILLLGFQGEYKIADRGQAKLADLQAQAARVVRAQKGEFERELSPHWRGATEVGVPLTRYLPVWVGAAAAGLVLLVAYIAFSFSLGGQTDPVDGQVRAIGRDVAVPVRAVERWVPPPAKTLDLAGFLAPEVAAGLVKVRDEPGKTTITLPGAGLFASGSAAVNSASNPLMKRIAEALNTVRGSVVVTGHTDSDPIPASLRLKFASNWELSQQRAEAVGKMLTGSLDQPGRIRADGRADTEPVAQNTSAENKALNRRVEILLVAQEAGV